MITAWRIVKTERSEGAFDGKGARLLGGRWNSRGMAIVYTASTASLAALEVLVHLTPEEDLRDFVIFACTFDESLIEEIDRKVLPRDWKQYPAPETLERIGDSWVLRESSVVLRVPSVIIDSESNYLLHPAHRDFKRIHIAEPVPFSLDMRLIRR